MLVGAEVVDPQCLGPPRLTGGLPVEEKDIGFYTLRVQDSRGDAHELNRHETTTPKWW